MRNVRADIAAIMKKYGHMIVYVKQNRRFRCDCYSERSGEANPDCAKCFGTSYQVTLHKTLVRRKIATVEETNPTLRRPTPTGVLTATAYTYYAEHDLLPLSGDIILEVEWNESKIPIRILEKFEVSVVEPLQGDSGRIEFYHLHTRYSAKGANDHAALT